MTALHAIVLVVALLSGATVSVAGVGIGSLLAPVLALRVGTPTAVAAVAIPHFGATALRCWRRRRSIDADVLNWFGRAVGVVVRRTGLTILVRAL